MRAVIDTNVLLSGLIWHGPPHSLIEHVRAGRLTLVSSPALLFELADVIARPKFRTILDRLNIDFENILMEVRLLAEIIDPPPLPSQVSRDPDDDAVLALAVATRPDFIVTGDNDLLTLETYNDIFIGDPVTALKIIQCFEAVQVDLSWDRKINENWPIKITKISCLNDIRDFYMPWYKSENKIDTDWNELLSRPVTVGSVADKTEIWTARIDKIVEYQKNFSSSICPEIIIPGYSLPDNRVLLLDGNHRCVGLVKADVQFLVTLVMLCGPIEESALKDLRHWHTSKESN